MPEVEKIKESGKVEEVDDQESILFKDVISSLIIRLPMIDGAIIKSVLEKYWRRYGSRFEMDSDGKPKVIKTINDISSSIIDELASVI
jgi:hypothetical protein